MPNGIRIPPSERIITPAETARIRGKRQAESLDFRMDIGGLPYMARGIQLGMTPEAYMAGWQAHMKELYTRALTDAGYTRLPTDVMQLERMMGAVRPYFQEDTMDLWRPQIEEAATRLGLTGAEKEAWIKNNLSKIEYLYGYTEVAPAGYQPLPQGWGRTRGAGVPTTRYGVSGYGAPTAGEIWPSPTTAYLAALPEFEAPGIERYYRGQAAPIYQSFLAEAYKRGEYPETEETAITGFEKYLGEYPWLEKYYGEGGWRGKGTARFSPPARWLIY